MKKIIKYFLIIIFIIQGLIKLYGQEALNKGVYSIAGSAQYSSRNYSTTSITENTGNISPQFTYFIVNNLSIGTAVNYNYSYTDDMPEEFLPGFNKLVYITLGPSIRYYFNISKIVPFLEASFNYSIYGIEQFRIDPQYTEHTFNYELKGGFEIFISKSVALEPSIGYMHTHSTMPDMNYTLNESNFELGIGISYFILPKGI